MIDNQPKMMQIKEDYIEVLDQTILPTKTVYLRIDNIKDAYSSILEMKVRGAPLISVVGLHGIRLDFNNYIKSDHSNNISDIKTYIEQKIIYIKKSRPTAVNLANDTDDLLKLIKEYNGELIKDIQDIITNFTNKIFDGYVDACHKISVNGADLIISRLDSIHKLNILTICNTGKLATPGDGTALGIIREINRRGKLSQLYIPETRPYNQGSRLTAYEAVSDNLPGILITDSMAGTLMQNGKIDCVIVGADRVVKNGSTANKIGTYSFAVLAKFHKIPFYVACPVSTIDEKLNVASDIIVEERPGLEMKKIGDLWIAPEQIKCFNPAFDITGPSLIEKIITENGEYIFDKTVGNWEQLDYKKLENYMKNKINLYQKNEKISINDVADGNLNLVYHVQGESKSSCVKQALPYVKCVGPQWLLSLKRAMFEAESLKYESSICPDMVPKFYHFDDNLALLIMEFLENHIILRKQLISQKKVKNLGIKIGQFVAKTCFFSSGLYLSAEELRSKMSFWNDNTLCTLSEQVIFSDPYIESPLNHWTTPFLNETVKEIQENECLIKKICLLRHKFISHKQALIHGDLHTGSIMVDEKDSIKVIDSEFAFYGPIGFDTGAFISNLLLSFFSQKGHSINVDFEEYILKEIEIFWESFTEEWNKLWNIKENRKGDDYPDRLISKNEKLFHEIKRNYIQEIWENTLEFAGAKIIRRIVGVAHVADLETINDLEKRSICEKNAIEMAKHLLIKTEEIKNVNDLIKLAKSLNK